MVNLNIYLHAPQNILSELGLIAYYWFQTHEEYPPEGEIFVSTLLSRVQISLIKHYISTLAITKPYFFYLFALLHYFESSERSRRLCYPVKLLTTYRYVQRIRFSFSFLLFLLFEQLSFFIWKLLLDCKCYSASQCSIT